MTIENGPTDTDYQRALQLLLFAADGVDVEGVNFAFERIGQQGRAGQTILALSDCFHMFLREADRITPGVRDQLLAMIKQTLMQYDRKGTAQ